MEKINHNSRGDDSIDIIIANHHNSSLLLHRLDDQIAGLRDSMKLLRGGEVFETAEAILGKPLGEDRFNLPLAKEGRFSYPGQLFSTPDSFE